MSTSITRSGSTRERKSQNKPGSTELVAAGFRFRLRFIAQQIPCQGVGIVLALQNLLVEKGEAVYRVGGSPGLPVACHKN